MSYIDKPLSELTDEEAIDLLSAIYTLWAVSDVRSGSVETLSEIIRGDGFVQARMENIDEVRYQLNHILGDRPLSTICLLSNAMKSTDVHHLLGYIDQAGVL